MGHADQLLALVVAALFFASLPLKKAMLFLCWLFECLKNSLIHTVWSTALDLESGDTLFTSLVDAEHVEDVEKKKRVSWK